MDDEFAGASVTNVDDALFEVTSLMTSLVTGRRHMATVVNTTSDVIAYISGHTRLS